MYINMSFGANYNGKQPNNTAYIKNFVNGTPANLWKTYSYTSSDGSNHSDITTNSNTYESL